jgi:hypothetical protein
MMSPNQRNRIGHPKSPKSKVGDLMRIFDVFAFPLLPNSIFEDVSLMRSVPAPVPRGQQMPQGQAYGKYK